jgi:formylglycine-generating enzyme required for sulfatase activity
VNIHLTAPSLIAAPSRPQDWPAWQAALARWRTQARQRLAYSDEAYRQPEFAWAARTYSCGFVFMYDRQFYDAGAGAYRIDDMLEHAAQSFGGYDAVVLWHAYPRLGFDDRNQFDFYRDMPGGLPGLRQACQALQSRGVRVFINYNPWDLGTRREAVPDTQALADMVHTLGTDGIFLDTMSQGSEDLRRKLDDIRPGVVLESEGALPLVQVHSHHMSWAQNFDDGLAPGVLRNKYFERRHMQHAISRWRRNHTDELHMAWMNGCGVLVWENVFGTWVGWNERDRSLLRCMLPVQRRFSTLFSGERWTPLVPALAGGVFASLWQADGLRLWTLVNRAETPVHGPLILAERRPGERYFDLVAGCEIQPGAPSEPVTLSGDLGPRGIGAFLAVAPGSITADLEAFLRGQADVNARASFSVSFPLRQAVCQPAPRTAPCPPDRVPKDMLIIPAVRTTLTTEMRVRECGFYEPQTPDVYDLPYLHTTKVFRRMVHLGSYAMDAAPVTNAQFEVFLQASGYVPTLPHNFLRHWTRGRSPAEQDDHPVVYVDLADARAYARWAGKRLPTEAEWQYAAQGPEGQRYPWGNTLKPDVCNPGGSTTAVKSYPAGRSPWGCWDMCGNVWHWTESEHDDGRTRFCMLRGGSYYRASGSDWYADGGVVPPAFAAKFVLMWPGLDRCATIGFRCVLDVQ